MASSFVVLDGVYPYSFGTTPPLKLNGYNSLYQSRITPSTGCLRVEMSSQAAAACSTGNRWLIRGSVCR